MDYQLELLKAKAMRTKALANGHHMDFISYDYQCKTGVIKVEGETEQLKESKENYRTRTTWESALSASVVFSLASKAP